MTSPDMSGRVCSAPHVVPGMNAIALDRGALPSESYVVQVNTEVRPPVAEAFAE